MLIKYVKLSFAIVKLNYRIGLVELSARRVFDEFIYELGISLEVAL